VRAVVNLKDSPNYRRHAFENGLKANGYTVVSSIARPTPDDVVIVWNRYGQSDNLAKQFESAGANVLVAENGYMGKSHAGNVWYALSRDQHNGAGRWPCSNGDRYRYYGQELKPYRNVGKEVVALPQRGIGPAGVAMPNGWELNLPVKCRTRMHPGVRDCVPLLDDLKSAIYVITWGSGAAIKAMAEGIPVFYEFKNWIAKDGATHISKANFEIPQKPDRQKAFEKIYDAMWTLDEIESGEAIGKLCAL
jgi:hypothetical protein